MFLQLRFCVFSVFFLISSLTVLNAQISSLLKDSKDQAEDMFNDLGYHASIPMYQSKENLSVDQMRKIATAYRLNHDTENAEIWYKQFIQKSSLEDDLLYYAQALLSNNKPQEAKVYFQKYHDAIGEADVRGIAFVNAIDAGVKHTECIVNNEAKINSDHLDFSPAYYHDKVVFVSTREVKQLGGETKDNWINDHFMALFVAEKQDNELVNPVVFAPELNTPYHEGPLSFSKNGDKVFFTRNIFNKGKRTEDKNGVMRLNIFTSSLEANGKWADAIPLNFNKIESDEAHPSISKDGQTLYFASNRAGGFGGMDIYKTTLQNGKWSKPQNLGDKINTSGNEAFPYIHSSGRLYFASDGHGGLGGMDIFSTTMQNEKPENIGTPFNSPKDDFGFIINDDLNEGYFSSARDGGNGKDDIYSFTLDKSLTPEIVMPVCIYIESGDNRIANEKIKITQVVGENDLIAEPSMLGHKSNLDGFLIQLQATDIKGKYTLAFVDPAANNSGDVRYAEDQKSETIYVTDEKGKVSFAGIANAKYKVEMLSDKYEIEPHIIIVPASQDLVEEICFEADFKKSKNVGTVSLVGQSINKKYGNMLPEVKLSLINLCTGEESETISDKDGKFDFGCVPCGCEFKVTGVKKHFNQSHTFASTLNLACDKVACEKDNQVVVNIEMTPENTFGTPQEADVVASFRGTPLKEGAVIELRNIYYDFDQSFIRSDATEDLNHVVELMNKYPTMEIELGSHTDARGSNQYNSKLSQQRANEARKYIVAKGIDNRRITAKGYGETLLRNKCADYIECSESDHQYNRRTEIKILKMHQDVPVHYIGNAPSSIDKANPNRRFSWK